MRKEDNDWSILLGQGDDSVNASLVDINGTSYDVDDKTACIVHAILLLVDAINDKDFK